MGDRGLEAVWRDGLRSSRSQRQAYREAFGLGPGQRLMLVTSTWGEDSLYGRWPALIDMLAQQLPLDSWRVAVMLHPNISRAHSPWQVHRWLDRARQDGVLVLDEGEADLRVTALVAADVVVGDHGAVTYWAASQGVPVVLADTPVDVVEASSPIGELLRVAPRLEPGDLAPSIAHQVGQRIELAIAMHDPHDPHDPHTCARLRPMPAAHIVDDLLDMLGLKDCGGQLLASPAAAPTVEVSEPSATLVRTDLRVVDQRLDIVAHRYAAGSMTRPWDMPAETHLVTDACTPDLGMLPETDVIVHHAVADAALWARRTLRELPGCQLAAASDPQGWLLALPDSRDYPGSFRSVRLHTLAAGHVFASAIHDWSYVAGHDLNHLPSDLTLHLASQTVHAAVVPA